MQHESPGEAVALAVVVTPSRRGALVAVKTIVNCSTDHDQMPRITLHRSRLYFTCAPATQSHSSHSVLPPFPVVPR